jgi:hypothetical protein
MKRDPYATFIKVWLGGSLATTIILVTALFVADRTPFGVALFVSIFAVPFCLIGITIITAAPIGALAWATRKLRIQSLVLSVAYAGLVVGAGIYLYVEPRIVREVDIDAMYGFKNLPPSRAGAKEEYFATQFPTAKEIEDYWFDSTLLISDPPRNNRIYYFDKDYHFKEWANSGLGTESWAISPFQERLKLGSRSRLVTIQCFAVLMDVGGAQRDCVGIEDVTFMIHRARTGTREHRKGDVFGLSGRKKAPFYLPTKEPITIDSVLAELQRQSSQ